MKKENVVITKHGEKRSKERLGLNRKKIERRAKLAFERGKRAQDCTYAKDRRYLEARTNSIAVAVAHGEYCYIFNKKNKVCITVYALPHDFDKKKNYTHNR